MNSNYQNENVIDTEMRQQKVKPHTEQAKTQTDQDTGVHRYGGRVWAEAKEGRGAIFRFTLREKRS